MSAISDDAVCFICDTGGRLFACDKPGCNKTMHWWCNDDEHMPTSANYYCTGCRDELGVAHPPAAALEHECVICLEKKPASQFVKTLPECPCPKKNNRACAMCAYKIAESANGDKDKCKCGTCRREFASFVLPPTLNSAEQVVAITYNPISESDDEDWMGRMGDSNVEDDGRRVAIHDALFSRLPSADPADPADPANPDDSDDSDDADDANDPDFDPDTGSILNDVVLYVPTGNRRVGAALVSHDSGCEMDFVPQAKRRKGPAKDKVLVVRKEDLPSAGQRPHKNPKKDSGYRIAGTLPDLITDSGHKRSTYDSDAHRNRLFKEVTKGFDGNDLLDPMETEADAVAAHCFVLMFHSNYKVGDTGSTALTKHHKRIRALMEVERGLSDKSQFKESFTILAREVATRVATQDKANSATLNTPVHTIVKDYMSAFNCYCRMLLKEKAGEINAKLP